MATDIKEASDGVAACPGKPVHNKERAEMREVLAQSIRLAERQQLHFKVPREEGLMQKHRGMHFHFKPEIFVQVRGRTDFRLPKEAFSILPGEMCIIPTGVPHGETIYSDEKGPFRNLVGGFYSNILSLHLAHEAAPQRPEIETIEFFEAPNLDVLVTLTNTLVQTYHMKAPARDQVLKGLLIALLGMLQNLVETGAGEMNTDMGKVFQVKWLVRDQFSNAELNVKGIAERLQCSPDYLSHLFHRETGEKLIQYIHRVRIEGAVMALETTPLHVSEIAYASGFSDPAYFARVFKKQKGESPQEYRARLDARRTAQETNPKTIYFDHVDYTHGQPAGVDGAE